MRPSHDIQVAQAVSIVVEKAVEEARGGERRRDELAELPLLGGTIRRRFHGSEENGRVRRVERRGVRGKRKGMPSRAPT